MKKLLFSIKDTKQNLYSPILTHRTPVEAIRNFEQMIKSKKTAYSDYPADFQLEAIGELDEVTGQIKSYEQTQLMARATDYSELAE